MNRAVMSMISAACVVAGIAGASARNRAPILLPTPPSMLAKAALPKAFAAWLPTFEAHARQAGIGAATLAAAFRHVRYNAKVVALDDYQPEFVKPVGFYVQSRTTPAAIAKGRALAARHRALFDRVEKAYGVPREYLLAIWRVETGYGARFGGFNIIEALATLAFHGRRKGFWTDQLMAALRILDRGDVRLDEMRGSWAGAMGHTQLIPTTYLKRAVDFDGDGRRDLWGSLADAFASTANYLKQSGWRPGMPFGVEVRLPPGFDYSRAHIGVRQPVAAWRKAGVTLADGKPLPDYSGDTSVVVPAGHRGPAFLVTTNYRALLHYNNAASYAMTVGILAERIAGRGRVVRPWPNHDRLLRREQKEELQRRLAALGYDPGPIDGKVGSATRAAIRDFQKKLGNPADGYADFALLQLVRRRQPKNSKKTGE